MVELNLLMRAYLLKEEFPTSKIYSFLVAQNMAYMMGRRNQNFTVGLEDTCGPNTLNRPYIRLHLSMAVQGAVLILEGAVCSAVKL